MKSLKYVLVGTVLLYLTFAVWMNAVAFLEVKCNTIVFSLTWPVFALAKHVPVVETVPGYEWVEMKIAGSCL